MSLYFSNSNVVDMHNAYSQSNLALEKHWVVTDGFKRLATTIISKTVVDAFLGFKHGIPKKHCLQDMLIQSWVGLLVQEMFNNRFSTIATQDERDNMYINLTSETDEEDSKMPAAPSNKKRQADDDSVEVVTPSPKRRKGSSQTISDPGNAKPPRMVARTNPPQMRTIAQAKRTTGSSQSSMDNSYVTQDHKHVRLRHGGKNRRNCGYYHNGTKCNHLTQFYCSYCGTFFCNGDTTSRKCFEMHVNWCQLMGKPYTKHHMKC